ncbi:hypothetical protein [Snuella lapsa]|uniref:hypothetical protein n=1 Tax=Snuella lapsa TaxID=870481 RepID=UPI0031F1378F
MRTKLHDTIATYNSFGVYIQGLIYQIYAYKLPSLNKEGNEFREAEERGVPHTPQQTNHNQLPSLDKEGNEFREAEERGVCHFPLTKGRHKLHVTQSRNLLNMYFYLKSVNFTTCQSNTPIQKPN